jgi:DNA-binding winged helix-turn-helix (wHTH) protein/TolB-like protein/Tfp pilus assembly protein PilF
MDAAGDAYRFGPFRLDPARRLLEKAGSAVPLSPRGFDILSVLVENRDRVLSRAEIIAAVWPGQTVEAHNLSVQMSKLRQALGDGADDNRLIATVPGRGYRFVASLDPEPPPPATTAATPDDGDPRRLVRRRRRTIGAAVVIAVIAALAGLAAWRTGGFGARAKRPGLSIVVMPLRDLSDQPGHRYLADAISDDLTTDLAHLPGSVVIARETADSYAAKGLPVAEVGRRLGVRYLLEGSMRAGSGVLHVNAQLIDTATSAHIWAEQFDAPQGDPDRAREAIAQRLAGVLDVELVSAESARALRERPRDPDALDLFFRARSILDHGDTLQDFQQAQRLLERATAMQPGFAEALAELGSMLLRKVRAVDDPTDQADVAEARTAIARALALSPRNAMALAARASSLLIEGRTADAAYAARAALAIAPDNLAALSVLARVAFAEGRLDEAAQGLGDLLRLNPESGASRSRLLQLGDIRLLQGRADEAIDLLHRSIAGDPDPVPGADSWGRAEGARMLLIGAYGVKGDGAAARDLYRRYAALWPHRSVWRIGATAPRAVAALPGFARFLAALGAAGMPAFADEHEDLHVAPSAGPVAGDAFAPTPLVAPGARTIDTDGLRRLIRDDKPLIIDLGHGAASPVTATWQDTAAQTRSDAAFLDATLAHPARRKSDPVVVMADGTFGYTAYNAALHLAAAGWTRVYWYRGGEEAWAAAKAPAVDRRS